MTNRKTRKQARKNRRRSVTVMMSEFYKNDPLGVDTRNFSEAVRQMLDRVKSGRAKEAVNAEIAAFERRLEL